MRQNISKRTSLVMGARRHLEWGHAKYVMDMIHSHPAQVNPFSFPWLFIAVSSICLGFVVHSHYKLSMNENCSTVTFFESSVFPSSFFHLHSHCV